MTPSLGLLLTTCVLMAAPAKEEDPAARAQATLQRVSKLPLDHQRVWLRLIEQRYGWAVLLTLKPEDAQRERARVAKILHQKTVAWDQLVGLLKELDEREKTAISRLVRQYRSQVYETFRTQPRDLVDRQDAWYRIWLLWEKAGSPPEEQGRLMDWLADAIKASTKDSIRPLPPDPKFSEEAELVPQQLVQQLTQPGPHEDSAGQKETGPAAPRPPAEEILPSVETQARWPLPLRVPDSPGVLAPMKLPSKEIVVGRGKNAEWLPLPAESPPAAFPPLRVLSPIAADDPRKLSTPPPPPHQALVVVFRREASAAVESSAEALAQAEPADARPQALGPRRRAAEMPPRTIDPPQPEHPVAALALVAPRPRPISPAENRATEPGNSADRLSQQNLVARLPHQPAEFAVPHVERPEEYRVERKVVAPELTSPSPLASPPAASTDQHAQVNVEELVTRVEGINLSLRNLESELHENRDFTVDRLDSLLSRLDILVLRQKDLALFRDLVTPQQQAKVGQIDSSRWAVASMGTRIAELRTRLRENDGMPQAERAAALKHLDELSDRLATLTAEK